MLPYIMHTTFDNVTIHYAHYFSKMSSFFNWQTKCVCSVLYDIEIMNCGKYLNRLSIDKLSE